MYKEWSGKSMAEVELLGKKAVVLEESYSSANEHIAVLRQQLDSAQQSLQVIFNQSPSNLAHSLLAICITDSVLERRCMTRPER
jgi:hypothetical protein